jgi:hypothetical protein
MDFGGMYPFRIRKSVVGAPAVLDGSHISHGLVLVGYADRRFPPLRAIRGRSFGFF